MNDNATGRTHWSFWAIGAVALIWHIAGAINFLMQMNADAVATMPETHRAIIDSRPVWATGGFALAVFGGATGCLLLLLRKSTASYLFIASALGVIVTMAHTIGVARSAGGFGLFEILMMIAMPLVVAVFLIWYSRLTARSGWIAWSAGV